MDKNIVFATAGVERIRVDSSGNVGIGTTVNNSGYLFQVNGRSLLGGTTKGVEIGADAANTAYIDFHSQDSKTTDYDTRVQSFGGGVNDALGQLQYYGGSHYFYGNVGIGTTNPRDKLQINGNTMLGTPNGTTANGGFSVYAADSIAQTTGNNAVVQYGNTAGLRAGYLASAQWGGTSRGGVNDYGNAGNIGGSYYISGNVLYQTGEIAVRNDGGTNSTCTPGSHIWYTGGITRNSTGSLVGAFNERMRIDGTSGYVGIGAADPQFNLQVNGYSHFGDGYDGSRYGLLQITRPENTTDNKYHLSFIRNGNSVGGIGYQTNSNTLAILNGSMYNNTTQGIFIKTNGYVGIGSTDPQDKLSIEDPGEWSVISLGKRTTQNNVFTGSNIYRPTAIIPDTGQKTGTTNFGGDLYFQVGGLKHWSYGAPSYGGAIILRAGSVWSHGDNGTGQSADYGGSIYLDTGCVMRRVDGTNGVNISSAAIPGDIHLRTGKIFNLSGEAAVAGQGLNYDTRLFISGTNGNVGINTTNPDASLHVYGGGGEPPMRMTNALHNWRWWRTGPDNVAAYVIYNDQGTGAYMAWGATSWTANSDIRLKRDIQVIPSSLDSILRLNPVYYNYHTDSPDYTRRSGFIAQEVAQVFPIGSSTVVFENNTEVEDATGNMIKPLGISMTEMIPYLVKSIQELKAEKDSEITYLKSKISQLEGMLYR